jgi:hypothetical protein
MFQRRRPTCFLKKIGGLKLELTVADTRFVIFFALDKYFFLIFPVLDKILPVLDKALFSFGLLLHAQKKWHSVERQVPLRKGRLR